MYVTLLKGRFQNLSASNRLQVHLGLFCRTQADSEDPTVHLFFLSFAAHPPLPPAGVGVDSCRSLGESQGPGAATGRGAPGCMHPAMWVADFFTSGWSGGDNDLTCLEEPWTAAEIWDGEGSRAQTERSWGLRTPLLWAWPRPSMAACGLAPKQGTDLLCGWHRLSSLFPATFLREREKG